MKCDTTASLALLLVSFTSNSVVAAGYEDRTAKLQLGIVFGFFGGVVLLMICICCARRRRMQQHRRDVTVAHERDRILIPPPMQPPPVITYTGSPTEPAMPTSQTHSTAYSSVNCNYGYVPNYGEPPPPYNAAITAPAAPYYLGASAPPASAPPPPKY